MPINVEIRDEDGRVHGLPWDGYVDFDLEAVAAPDSRCIRFVDPYGDSVFNRLQVPVLRDELLGILPRLSEENRNVVRSLVAYIDAERDWIHLFLVFVGD